MINPKAIKVLKRVMTKKQRYQFIKNIERVHGEGFEHGFTRDANMWDLFHGDFCFYWAESRQGTNYWQKIRNKISDEELRIKLFN